MKTIALLSQLLLLFLGVFLMIVVLLQRGRGGGLAGAFGGLGGQSAFGTKAGDVFTKITVGIAVAWVLVAGGSGSLLRNAAVSQSAALGVDAPEEPGMSADGETTEDGPLGGAASPAETPVETPAIPTPDAPADVEQ